MPIVRDLRTLTSSSSMDVSTEASILRRSVYKEINACIRYIQYLYKDRYIISNKSTFFLRFRQMVQVCIVVIRIRNASIPNGKWKNFDLYCSVYSV